MWHAEGLNIRGAPAAPVTRFTQLTWLSPKCRLQIGF